MNRGPLEELFSTPDLWFLAKLPPLWTTKIRIISSKGEEIRFSHACMLADPLAKSMALAQREFPSSTGPARFPVTWSHYLCESPFPSPSMLLHFLSVPFIWPCIHPRVNLGNCPSSLPLFYIYLVLLWYKQWPWTRNEFLTTSLQQLFFEYNNFIFCFCFLNIQISSWSFFIHTRGGKIREIVKSVVRNLGYRLF